MDETERMLTALNLLFQMQRGTLWKIKDTCWEKLIPDFEKKRYEHPGLCLGRKDLTVIQRTMSMLLGGSRKKSGFQVKGVFEERGEEAVTYFRIRPLLVPVSGLAGKDPEVRPNPHKPMLLPEELKDFNEYLKSKGLNL